MIVALPFCEKDEWLALKNLEWVRSLDGGSPLACLVCHDDRTEPGRVIAATKEYFAEVRACRYSAWTGEFKSPQPQNHAWQETARWIAHFAAKDAFYRDSWFWWEADACPLRKGWLNAIADEHERGNKPFSGHVVAGFGYMAAPGVYPANVVAYTQNALFCRGTRFDQAAGNDIRGKIHPINHLIENIRDRDGAPPSFSTVESVRSMKDLAVFHRCKDGSIIDLLSTGKRQSPKRSQTQESRPSKCIVQLGKYGDILNILPVAKAIFDRDGIKPAFMVQKFLADVLDGVSYVEPEIFDGDFADLKGAVGLAQKKFSEVIVPQVMGRDFEKRRDAYNVEAWSSTGYMAVWNRLPLVIDRRDLKREAVLVKKHSADKPMLLWAGTGYSSPFDPGAILLEDIRHRWGHRYNVVDLGPIKADRIYDLLGLYDAAKLLVTIDTSTMHLAPASRIPYVALVSDRNSLWHGTRPRGNCRLEIRYSEVLERREEIHQVIDSIGGGPSPRLWHVHSDYSAAGETARRHNITRATWRTAYAANPVWRPMPLLDQQLPRMFADEKRKLPYLKDVIEMVAAFADPWDFVVLTNTDICFASDIADRILPELEIHGMGYGHRRDFARVDRPLSEKEIAGGNRYAGNDIFAFRISWWLANRHAIPDMLLGAEGWDCVVREFMIEKSGGKCCVWDSLIYHERHASMWEQPENRFMIASQAHNLKLAKKFFIERGVDYSKFGMR